VCVVVGWWCGGGGGGCVCVCVCVCVRLGRGWKSPRADSGSLERNQASFFDTT